MTKRLKGVANLPLAPFVGVLFGVVAAILILNTPSWMLEKLVNGAGLATILPAAAPPLGDTARTLLAVITGLLVALPLWLIMRAIEGEIHKSRVAKARGSTINGSEEAVIEGRRRSPIRAGAELGAPLMSDEALSNGGELLLSEPVASDSVPTSPYEPVRQAQEETLVDLGSWQRQQEATLEQPFDLSEAELIASDNAHSAAPSYDVPSYQVPTEASRTLPPVSWDEPSGYNSWEESAAKAAEPSPADATPSAIDFVTRAPAIEEFEAEAPTVALPWETIQPGFEPAPVQTHEVGGLDPFNLSASAQPDAMPIDLVNEAPSSLPSPVTFETVSFETVPVDDVADAIDIARNDSGMRPIDILDDAGFLTPDMLGDDFQEESAALERGLSTSAFAADPLNTERQAESFDAEPGFEADLQVAPESPVSFETAPVWHNDAPFDLVPPSPFSAAEASPFVSEITPSEATQSPAPSMPNSEDDASLLDLLDRLEAALAKRSSEPAHAAPAPTNLAALREILNQTQTSSNSPRAAGGGW